jgi:hypothetical protein
MRLTGSSLRTVSVDNRFDGVAGYAGHLRPEAPRRRIS